MKNQSPFPLELLAMVAVIAISSWHVGNYMEKFDGWIMATLMGATLGFCNFLCAHDLFKSDSTSRRPASAGLFFFAITSTWMQYTYYNANPAIGQTLVQGVNLDALALGMWAPAAEILLGWLRASKTSHRVNASNQLSNAASNRQQEPSVMGLLGAALAKRIEPTTPAVTPALMVQMPPSNQAPLSVNQVKVNGSTEIRPGRSEASNAPIKVEVKAEKKKEIHEEKNEDASKLTREERHQALLNLLSNVNDESQIQPSKLADHFNVTRQTIHNDLAALQQNGHLHVNGTVQVIRQ